MIYDVCLCFCLRLGVFVCDVQMCALLRVVVWFVCVLVMVRACLCVCACLCVFARGLWAH